MPKKDKPVLDEGVVDQERFKVVLGQRIKAARIEADVNQGELADLIGTHKVSVSRIEGGSLRPSAYMIHLIAKALKVHPGEIMPSAKEVTRGRASVDKEILGQVVRRVPPGRKKLVNPGMVVTNGFRERLKLLRLEKGLSQKDLADKVGVQPSRISTLEARESSPRKKTVAKFAKALGVRASELATGV